MCSNFLSKFGRDVSSRRAFAMRSAWKDIPKFKSEKGLQMLCDNIRTRDKSIKVKKKTAIPILAGLSKHSINQKLNKKGRGLCSLF